MSNFSRTSDLIVTPSGFVAGKKESEQKCETERRRKRGGLPLCASSLMMLESKQIIQYVLYTTRGRRGGAGALCLSKKGRRCGFSGHHRSARLPRKLGHSDRGRFFPNHAFVPSSAFGRPPEEKGREHWVESISPSFVASIRSQLDWKGRAEVYFTVLYGIWSRTLV